jgi:branched-chain amino acid transport system permease protein
MMTSSMSFSGRMMRDLLTVTLPVVAAMLILPSLYSNHLLLFNFVMFMTLAQGLNVIYGFTGILPLGYVGFFGAGAYGFAMAVMHLNAPPFIAFGLAGAASVIVGLLLIPLLKLSGAYFAIANMAASLAIYQVISNPDLTPLTKGPYGVSLQGVFSPAVSYACAVAILAFSMVVVSWLRNSKFGLSLQAVREDPISAATAGVSVARVRTIAWLISAWIAGLIGGVFAWHISVFYPDSVFDLGISISAIVFTLFGGSATLVGPIVGVAILYGAYNAIGISVPQYFQIIYGALIIALMLFLPNGIVSILTRRGIRVP